jgi:hypothetical protein
VISSRSMEQRSRWRWISVVCFSQIALKFGDEDLQFFFRQIDEIALGQIRAAALKFGIFGEKLCHQLHHFRSRLGHAQALRSSTSRDHCRRPFSG